MAYLRDHVLIFGELEGQAYHAPLLIYREDRPLVEQEDGTWEPGPLKGIETCLGDVGSLAREFLIRAIRSGAPLKLQVLPGDRYGHLAKMLFRLESGQEESPMGDVELLHARFSVFGSLDFLQREKG